MALNPIQERAIENVNPNPGQLRRVFCCQAGDIPGTPSEENTEDGWMVELVGIMAGW